jgi:integrase
VRRAVPLLCRVGQALGEQLLELGVRAAPQIHEARRWWPRDDLYATELRSHALPAFASMPLPDITRRDVQEWVNALAASGLAAATVRHSYRAVFKSVLNDAIDDGLLARSPCNRIELPAATVPVIDPLTPAQILALADRIDPRYRAMVLLAAGCGLRWSEAAGLTRDRIHLGTRAQVTIDRQLGYRPATTRHGPCSPRPRPAPRAASSRCPPPSPPRCAPTCAATRPARPGCCSPTPAGNVLNPANWRQRIWRPLTRSALGIPPGTTFHRLRHAYASLLGDAGLPDHDIQLRLGHAHPGEVRWYRHPYPGPRRRPGHPRRHRHRPCGSRNRPRAVGSVLTLLTEELTRPEPGTGQHARFRRSRACAGAPPGTRTPNPRLRGAVPRHPSKHGPAGHGTGAPRQRRQRRSGGPEPARQASTFRNCRW